MSQLPRCTCRRNVLGHEADCPRHYDLGFLADAAPVPLDAMAGVSTIDGRTLARQLKAGPCEVPGCFVCKQEQP